METSDPGLESLIRDIMIVASECEFDNDIHMLVDSLSYQDPASCSLDGLMDINDRYGDIVYNLISLREMYNQPIHELIDGPAFPLLLDEDRDPDEIKAALAMVSHTQKAEDANRATPTINFALSAASKLHPEPTTSPPQEDGASYPSSLATNEQQLPLYPSQPYPSVPMYSAINAQLASSPVQLGSPTGENLLLSSLQEMSVRQTRYHHGPFGVTSAGWNHSWVMPTDARVNHHPHHHHRDRKRAVSSNSSSSSNEVYHPHNLSKKKFRRLSEPAWHSQMEPTVEKIVDDRGGRYSYPYNGPLIHPSFQNSQPQASFECTPLQNLPGMNREGSSSTPGQRTSHPSAGDPSQAIARPERTSNSSNDEEKGLDFHWLNLKAARERRACRRHRRIVTPRGSSGAYQEDEEEEEQAEGGGPTSYLGGHDFDPSVLGLTVNKGWGPFQAFANSFSGVSDPTWSGPVPPPVRDAGVTDRVNEGVALDTGSVEAESTTMARGRVVTVAPPTHTDQHTTPEPSKGLSAPPPPQPFQQSGSVPESPTRSSSMGSVESGHQLESKSVGLNHGPPRRRSKHKDDNEYHGLKLWQFLLHLLLEGKHPSILRWVSKGDGLFRVLDSEGLAKMWGGRRGHTDMNYDKMSRALRYYYNKNLLDKAPKRLHYQFKYYSRWWEKLQAVDTTFKMAVVPQPPEMKLAKDEIIAMGIVDCEGAGQAQDSRSPHDSRNS